jgi:hypothetical protein
MIVPRSSPLQLKTYDLVGLKTLIEEKTKDWYTYGEDKEENKCPKPFLWNAL